ncbi:hypothetical protein JQ600_16140 [Bradyrhizobium sp. AUGA SZCCT0176]|uniref:hypothetical protein n=1 Tax=Bradyrhizobium sp. AUGA SZCCT0176 TaxID=2807664 RepID=UPI001BADE4C6|nr:hypothetical protein [Bradyrhizobium sp. AUGA SZCCT0176]MBR1226452.1 hypothetical protein [Bradyrhizobium sp. AUGA SZCCT0176]
MSIFVGILIAILGTAMIVVGSGFVLVFRMALRIFDQSLSSEFAGQGREQVERIAMKISNPFVRQIVLKHVVTAGGTLAVSLARGAIESRKRTALYLVIAGVLTFALACVQFAKG